MADDSHPSNQELSEFMAGKLPGSRMTEIEQHIEHCKVCCSALGELSEDSLTRRLSKVSYMETPQTFHRATQDGSFDLGDDSRYEIVRLLGGGGMGNVYQAKHKLMQRVVALKTIRPELTNHPEAQQRFLKEARAAARLSHPNIVTAHDAERSGAVHFLVLEFVDGEGLDAVVNRQGPLSAIQACDYICQAAGGLQHALERQMVHRDIKPQNLMLNKQGTIKILDFGLAKFRREHQTQLSEEQLADEDTVLTLQDSALGTEGYMAPEQARDARSVDIRSDVFSLGCTLFFLLTNRPPFLGVPPNQPQATPKVAMFREDLPTELYAILDKMMADEAENRFQTPQQVIEAIESVDFSKTGVPESISEPPPPGPPAAAGSGDKPVSRRNMLIAIAIIALSALLVFLVSLL